MKKKTYAVEGMHCTSCAIVIESDLEDIGVRASCSYAKQTLEVEYDEEKASEDLITQTAKNSGYIVKKVDE